jgi:polyisoprenoid-binding protein YceI
MKRLFTTFALISALVIPNLALSSTWNIDPDHSNVGFKIRHMMVSNVTGRFATYTGTVNLDDADITKSTVDVSIDTASINTNVQKRDEDLRSANFFDVAKYPKMTFVSKKISKAGSDHLLVKGILTLHGVSKDVVLDVEGPTMESKDPWGNIRKGATATTTINRKDFGLTWNAALETGGVLVGDEVNITLEIEMIKAK